MNKMYSINYLTLKRFEKKNTIKKQRQAGIYLLIAITLITLAMDNINQYNKTIKTYGVNSYQTLGVLKGY